MSDAWCQIGSRWTDSVSFEGPTDALRLRVSSIAAIQALQDVVSWVILSSGPCQGKRRAMMFPARDLEKPCPHPLRIIGQVGPTPAREAARFSQRSTPRSDGEHCPVGTTGR